jgi:catechol 2,3-dioxygenase-like lactoylglutathione lyase family enzyme
MLTRLDHIQLAMPPSEEQRAREFWCDVLGMTEEVKPEPLVGRGGCWFRTGVIIVHLGVQTDFAPQRKAHPAFCVDDLDGLAARLKAAGYPVIPDEALPDCRRFYTADPFGNRIEFIAEGDGFGQK